jgi:hypothetical protein
LKDSSGALVPELQKESVRSSPFLKLEIHDPDVFHISGSEKRGFQVLE